MKKSYLSAMAISVLLLTGCASSGKPVQYSYNDIPPQFQGEWKGEFTETATGKKGHVAVMLKPGQMTPTMVAHNKEPNPCIGRLKYQRTEDNFMYTYLEHIDQNPTNSCQINSYIRFVDNGDGSFGYVRFNMQGKAVASGGLAR